MKKVDILNNEDMGIFKELCDYCLNHDGFDGSLDPYTISEICKKPVEELAENIEALEEEGYLKDEKECCGTAFASKSITNKGFCHYFTSNIDDHDKIYKDLINAIYELELSSSDEIIEKTDINKNIVHKLISYFKNEGYITAHQYKNIQITTKGKRSFKNLIYD